MKQLFKYMSVALFAVLVSFTSCQERYVTYSDAEYIMFADTAGVYPVQLDQEYFAVPVVSTVVCDYDRTIGVEIVDAGSDAIENLHYTLKSNTITIKAGENKAEVLVAGNYDKIDAEVRPMFKLKLVVPDKVVMPLYGDETKVYMAKCCPFDINDFTGWCVTSSQFLLQYNQQGTYQRLVYTEKHPSLENTIICRNWLYDGYDVTISFDPTNPLNPIVKMDAGQIISDEGSVFGIVYGDDKIQAENSTMSESVFYPCGRYLYLWTHIFVEDLGQSVGTVGHFYNVMEWISDEEADRLKYDGMEGK